MRMKVVLLTVTLCLILSGCSAVRESLESEMLQNSGITEDSDYLEYQSYNDQGKLDQQGYYREDIFESDAQITENFSESVHISFATNNYLNVKYFSDANFTVPLDTSNCSLIQGDRIYAMASVSNSAASSMYTFWGFYVYRYDGDTYERITTIPSVEGGLVMEVAPEHIGAELSIAPIGSYETRMVSLTDYYMDDNGGRHDLPGTWSVDDRQCTDSTIEINPMTSYIVSYEYDSEEYFFLSSDPQCYYNNNADGIVIFERRESMDETMDYSVELRKYILVDMPSNQRRNVSLNNGEEKEIKAGNILSIPGLKYGDKVTIVTDSIWPELENSQELICQGVEPLANGKYKYTSIVPQKGGEFAFNPAEYSYEHGTITFRCFGEEVKNTQYLAAGSKIIFEQKSAEEGYQLADGDHIIVVGEEADTKRQLI